MGEILALGAIAGFTVFLGLPLGRMRSASTQMRALLNAGATGILLFLFWDVLSEGVEPVEAALDEAMASGGTWLHFSWLALVFAVSLIVGLMSLVYYDLWLARRARAAMRFGPGAANVQEFRAGPIARLTPAQRLAFFIALGIGFHNLSEGLAIGQSAAGGQLRLALVLVIGFALHNATEGFGIVGPLAGEAHLPSWRFLGALGLIAGGPTFIGTVIGQSFQNETVFAAFLALAAGSILYVVIELLAVARKLGHKDMTTWGVLAGLILGFATDFILHGVGA
ncbi:MAG TPA: ZIP family metal transporter [Methylomirabilota bacterium]|nr:ZIP family metal transporter [Methylomirabilota bacterium]